MPLENDDPILYLNRSEVEQACLGLDSVSIIRDVFALHGSGQTILPDEAYLGWTNEQGSSVRSLNMPAYIGGDLRVAGIKIINSNPANPAYGFPRASGLTLLSDALTTRVLCVMDSAYISSLRTASVTALSVELFNGGKVERLAVIGAGPLAYAHINLLVKRFASLRSVYLFDLDPKRSQSLADDLTPLLQERQVALSLTSSAEEAVRSAQVIVPATTTREGYIAFDWLEPGSLLVNISLDDPLPEVVFSADKVIVDDWPLVKNDPHRLIGRMYRAGQVLGPDDPGEAVPNVRKRIHAQLADVVLENRSARSSSKEVILVNPFGLAIEDIAIAAHVYRYAQSQELGVLLKR